jgi:hypothetical protein
MPPVIDATTYNKHAKWPTGHGYEPRHAAPTSIVVHSTSSATKNTMFTAEANYLYNAPLVSAHFLVGKDGAIVQFLDPRAWAAWHAGNAIPAWSNQRSIGIELHHSVGDPFYPQPQIDALNALVMELCGQFTIPTAVIETHGQIALPGPYVRKHDPADWPYAGFVLWRSRLDTPPPPVHAYTVVGVPIYQRQDLVGALAGHLTSGDPVQIDATYANGAGHLADGRGFVDLDGLVSV